MRNLIEPANGWKHILQAAGFEMAWVQTVQNNVHHLKEEEDKVLLA